MWCIALHDQERGDPVTMLPFWAAFHCECECFSWDIWVFFDAHPSAAQPQGRVRATIASLRVR